MGAGQTLAGIQLPPAVAFQMRKQRLGKLAHRGKGVYYGGNGFVFQPEFLGASGKLIMVNRCRLAQSVIVPGPIGNQQGSHLAQPGIVLRQNFQKSRIFVIILENPAFLFQNPVILRQSRVIVRPQLT